MTRAGPQLEVWHPHAYQARAVSWLASRASAALFLDPGLGKTSSTLAAFTLIKEQGVGKRMLVIAPKRVCYLVWRQEGEKWAQFSHLRFSLLHGRNKEAALKEDADVYLINPEGVPWLIKQFKSTRAFADKFDTLCIDELTKFKNAKSKRFKALYPYASACARRWGLTGTPAPNGLEDLFGQVKMLDDGNALGRYITRFRDKYFVPGFDGYTFKPRQGAEEQIQDRLKDIALRMKAEDYLELPPLVDDIRRIELDPKARKQYDQMKKEMVADLDGGTISADNVAATYSKLKQMAGGAVYRIDKEGNRTWEHIHDAKIDALEELVEELNGSPVLVAYEFNHELERILERFGDIPYLGKGTSDAQAVEIEKAWNANEIPILPVHPASTGHGLNLQKGSACHICWFNPTWDFELYDQLIRRLYRQGSKASTIFNHILAVENSIDFLVINAVKDKDTTQARLVQGLGEELGVASDNDTKENEMVQKLAKSGWGKKAAATEETEGATETNTKAKGGWGARKAAKETVETETSDDTIDTKEQETKLTTTQDTDADADQAADSGGADEDVPAKTERPKRKRRTSKAKSEEKTDTPEEAETTATRAANEPVQLGNGPSDWRPYGAGFDFPGGHINFRADSPEEALDKLAKIVKLIT
ncbi:MAG: DEAD/DEAH box helicase [Epibacterium sp.]|nr:DEAD/DEAH box helicase [Epibacterium sp.]